MASAVLLGGAACEDGDFPNFIVPRVVNVARVPTSIFAAAGNGQVGVAGKQLPQPIVVKVLDQTGAAIENAVVHWTVLFGGGSVSDSSTITDVNGNTSVRWTLGPAAGVDSLRASIANGAFVIITATATAPAPVTPPPQIVNVTGDITPGVNQFRALLGTLNPNVVGEQPGGRREINWDGLPASLTNNDLFPGDFFNTTSPRGVVFTTPGSAFRISDDGYVDVNPNYAGEFNVFSSPKLFTTRGSTVTDVRFFVAGTSTPALVTGFGSVFADVGLVNSTTLEYFDAAGNRLAIVTVLRRSDAVGLSFAGAVFPSRIVARVRITSGNTPIDPGVTDNVNAGGTRDIVVMDDFIYGEPRITP